MNTDRGFEARIEKPVFVVGVPRAGTSLVYNIILSLPAFHGTGRDAWVAETAIFSSWESTMLSRFKPGPRSNWYNYFQGNQNCYRGFLKDAIRLYFYWASIAKGSRRIVEKTPMHIFHIAEIVDTFPDAKFVNVVRHPVDVLASMRLRIRNAPNPDDEWLKMPIPEFCNTYERRVKAAFTELHKEVIMTIKYEMLTAETKYSVQKLCSFIGEDYNENYLQGAMPVERRAEFPYQSTIPVRNSPRWQMVLDEREKDEVQRLCSCTMRKLEYMKY